MSPWVWLGVAVLGGAGALARFLLDTVISARAGAELPLGTLAINLSGAFLLGLLTAAQVSGAALVLLGTATLGAYTTFSTWMLETHRLAEGHRRRVAAANLALSLLAGLAAAALGRWIGGGLP